MKYYYADNQNNTAGPATSEEIRKFITDGMLGGDPMVVPINGGEWNRLSVFENGAGAGSAVAAHNRPVADPSAWFRGPALAYKNMGALTDSYSDVLDNQAANAPGLQKYFCERLAQRGMPKVALLDGAITDGGLWAGTLIAETRNYFFASTKSGALLAVRIAPFGNDIYISWHLFVQRLINWLVVLATFGLMALGGILMYVGRREEGLFGLGAAIAGLGGVLFWVVVLLGIVAARSPFHFFFKLLSFHDHEDIRAASTAVQNSLIESAELAGIKTKLRPKEVFVGGIRPRGI